MDNKPPIAVVGLAGVFPSAPHVQALWQNILAKTSAAGVIPQERWIAPLETMVSPDPAPDRAFSPRACLIHDFHFDPGGFRLDPDLLAGLDPLYHLVLQAGRDLLQEMPDPALLDRERTGVILAAIALPTEGASFLCRELFGRSLARRVLGESAPAPFRPLSRTARLAAKVTSLPGALLAEALGLGGGSYTLDAACASSLYALKLACDQLQAHRADAMLAGGVSRPDCLYTQVGFSQLKALSPSGRCAPFDAGADGLVVGEGAGLMLLKRLEDAVRDGDKVYGVIRGIGLSNDIGGNLLSPASEGQLRAMENAYRQAGWQPRAVDFIECHGAGTPVGDATELASLSTLWGPSGWQEGECALGAVKSMIGHLLTAAGAAGMIKTLMALKEGIVPPTLHFTAPAPGSPLASGPFRVPTQSAPWPRRAPDIPRRAAVSAFGFGGINAHLLLEEYPAPSPKPAPMAKKHTSRPKAAWAAREDSGPEPVAIVGMDAALGGAASLKAFQEAVLGGESLLRARPAHRFRGADDAAGHYLAGRPLVGGYLDDLEIGVGEFHIPPREIADILPQHLLMLRTAAGALKDASLDTRAPRPRMGVIVGMGFDYEATHFTLRWSMANEAAHWERALGLGLSPRKREAWLAQLKDAAGPPLTNTRTLGALGGVIAGRVAREFRLGGPSFVVSCEEAAGLKAMEIAVDLLGHKEADVMMVGAVDLAGDLRRLVIEDDLRPFSAGKSATPFDADADGTLPAEGAAALVLKPLSRALEDGDRIYAVIKGIGHAGGGGIQAGRPDRAVLARSLRSALARAGAAPASIGLVEAHGSGHPLEDGLEAEALGEVFAEGSGTPALSSLKSAGGHAGAAAGLLSLVKAALCLYQEILPPLAGFRIPAAGLDPAGPFHLPRLPQYWCRNREDGPRRACVSALTTDGNAAHVVLEEPPQAAQGHARERRYPAGPGTAGLFTLTGRSPAELLESLECLKAFTAREGAPAGSPAELARRWHALQDAGPLPPCRLALVAEALTDLERLLPQAAEAVQSGRETGMHPRGGIAHTTDPIGGTGQIAFVYPGSGNHYLGMGREIGLRWPEILREMDRETGRLKTHLKPWCFVPWRTSWDEGWEADARQAIGKDPLNMIHGQVVHGILMTRLASRFGIRPSAAIGYSLGESAALFSLGAWPEYDRMLARMQESDLFSRQLAGACLAARRAWNVPEGESFEWKTAVVDRPAAAVRQALEGEPHARLLIINTPGECVIGGGRRAVEAVIRRLACNAFYLEGVVTVHCDAALPVKDAYHRLHLLPTRPPGGIRFYSCALGRAYEEVTRESTADSILLQALEGFDFPVTIQAAYEDGVRIFLEMGPHNSCTRMIRDILDSRPHLAVPACVRGEGENLAVLKLLGTLFAHHIPLDLAWLYPREEKEPAGQGAKAGAVVRVPIGGAAPVIPRPMPPAPEIPASPDPLPVSAPPLPAGEAPRPALEAFLPWAACRAPLERHMEAVAAAHHQFLAFSDAMGRSTADTFALQNHLLEALLAAPPDPLPSGPAAPPEPAFSREMCLEFARGSAAKVLGPEFAPLDTYPVRVRLPDEPLMLVDRILTVEGEKGSLGSGKVVTEHDVLPGAWYLDGGRAPVCISVEAGQADLFLCSYLGIDFKVQGRRAYRLLDAEVEFHRGLPVPGDVIRYLITIEKFIRQGETYLFFFNFEGFIGSERLITMKDGCAGFFTEAEIRESGGILLTAEETAPRPGKRPADWQAPVPFTRIESYDDKALEALRAGRPGECFGAPFEGITLPESLRLPGGLMRLIHRVTALDPQGGRFGLGIIRAEADIHPDDWFLTCHFMDDMVMPGTLMYECCAHTLRVFLQRMGWVTETPGVFYEPVPGVKSRLKCRGPVTPATRKVVYEVEVREIGFAPEPFAVGDAHMYADGRRIVLFRNLSLQMTGIGRGEIDSFWSSRPKPEFDREAILEFALGSPSKAFGPPYRPFDRDRFIARLPNPPYLFLDRVFDIEPAPWVLKPGGWIEAEWEMHPDDWYFKAHRTPWLPFCALLEIALQPCGFLAAYMGSALKSDRGLHFRNLDGEAHIDADVPAAAGRLGMRARLTRASEAGDMLIETFDMEVRCQDQPVYQGTTTFGFFTPEALANQKGIREAAARLHTPSPAEAGRGQSGIPIRIPPLFPADPGAAAATPMPLAAYAIGLIDEISLYVPDGGPHGLGYVQGVKHVDPGEWFFKAHFFQDPVCPGSLGIESFLQLLRFMALDRWADKTATHRFSLVSGANHRWSYRGQILPQNRRVEVEAAVTRIDEENLCLMADGLLKVDGLSIYKMENFGIRLVPLTR